MRINISTARNGRTSLKPEFIKCPANSSNRVTADRIITEKKQAYYYTRSSIEGPLERYSIKVGQVVAGQLIDGRWREV